jgi:MoaA/NifB/PqqE/SkfB family radical SAM enzyme
VQVSFSGGEALIKPYAPELVAHGSGIGLFQEILTHGYWEDQHKIERLALANPWRITVSLDGIGDTHTLVRGHPKFWERTSRSIGTLQRMRREHELTYKIRLKTVIMAQNLHDVASVARFATQEKMEVFYQAIEQNYNTPEDPRWFEHSQNWPRDTKKAVATVEELIRMKREGYRIANSFEQLETMIPYFENPDSLRVAIQSHAAHERKGLCSALTGLQIQPNGDVIVCYGQKPVGNVRTRPVREIWETRPQFWVEGCCLQRRCSPTEKETLSLTVIS